MYPHSATISQVQATASELSELPLFSITTYKFHHTLIQPTARVGDIANKDGATHLSLFTNLPNMDQTSANLIFEEVGDPHIQPPRGATLGQAPVSPDPLEY